ncbi:MAG: DUF1588 domain-containing protein [Deltaproteobacteria bacterium]|nr:DUF1588 domain-containing protein [Deltaproteobacteria bacterium]MBP7286257.1 DUF1588 domain-containing protein [Nannocystaceae bacterium]
MDRARPLCLCIALATGCYSGLHGDGPQAGGETTGASGPGSDGGGDAADGADSSGGELPGLEVGAVPMRRLTNGQHVQSIRDLLALPDWTPAVALPDEGLSGEAFRLPNMVAGGVTTTLLDFGRYRNVAKEAAELALASDEGVAARLGCSPSGVDDPCVRAWLSAIAQRAWSRPVATDDAAVDELLAIVDDGTTRLGELRLGLQWGVIALLQTPEFLYFYPQVDPAQPDAMDDHSRARSLSLMFLDSVPDDDLLARARAGELGDPAVVEAEVDRLIAQMVADPAHRGAPKRFFAEWWSTTVVDAVGKDPTAYPDFTPTLRTAMRQEVEAMIDDLVFERRDDLRKAVRADTLYVNDELAVLYGVAGSFGPEIEAIELPPDSPRSGLLSTGAFLSVMSHPSTTSPAARGKFISQRLLCREIPPPPPNVSNTIPPPEGAETKRDRFERHTSDPTCAGCHKMMDPMGLALEEFDAIGAWRATEQVDFEGESYELPLDLAGELDGVAFATSRELAAAVAENPDLVPCVTRQFLRHALGRELEGTEEVAIDDLAAQLAAADFDFLTLMRQVAIHDVFTTIVREE